jgi:hypothetical protein
LGEIRTFKEVTSENNSTYLDNTNLDIKAIHIHGYPWRDEHTLWPSMPNITPMESQKY